MAELVTPAAIGCAEPGCDGRNAVGKAVMTLSWGAPNQRSFNMVWRALMAANVQRLLAA